MPSVTDETRRLRIQEALEAQRDSEERVREHWRGRQELLQVINIPVSVLLLNPHSHRIRAQLESHSRAEAVEFDPFGDEAQQILEDLLKGTAKYEDLKRDLANIGQRDPGVITVEGLLVNANRRAVALRDNGEDYIRVAVLPGDASPQEIAELELALQMKKDLKEEYSFTNELLFVHDLIDSYSHTAARVAEILGRSDDEVERYSRMYALVRELQSLSHGRIKTVFFDDKRQALQEIDEVYEETRRTDPEEALRIRHARLAGLLMEMGYRELREVNEDFLEDYFLPMLEEQNEMLSKPIRRITSEPTEVGDIPGVDVLGEEEAQEADPSRLLELIATTYGEPSVELPSEGGVRVTKRRQELVDELKDSMERAAEYSREDRLAIDRLKVPADSVRQATNRMKRALEKFQRVVTDPEFDLGQFKYVVRKAEAQLDAIKDEVARHDS